MYARPGDVMCPVTSFKKYLSKLHPDIEDLWQRPLDSFEENSEIWYYKAPVGKNTLSSMMVEISKLGKLSRLYTNHSIRATTITRLDDAGIEARHIMRASGHKSESSIRSYACRLSENKKREMSDCLSGVLQPCMSHKSNSSDVMADITPEELNSIFNDENVFLENPVLTGTASASENSQSNVGQPISVVNQSKNDKASVAQQLSVVNQMIKENPMAFKSTGFQICPTMNNCTVNFNFGQLKDNLT